MKIEIYTCINRFVSMCLCLCIIILILEYFFVFLVSHSNGILLKYMYINILKNANTNIREQLLK